MFRLRLLKLHRRWTVVVWREEPETESVRAFIAGRGKPAKMALRCLEWVTVKGTGNSKEVLNGTLDIRTAPGRGTNIVVRLPVNG